MRGRWLGYGIAAMLCCGGVAAGELDPPGAPEPTQPASEPRIPVGPETTPGDGSAQFVISEAGSYYLTGNLTGEPGLSGIHIRAGGVTLDLNGFSLQGVASSENGIATTAKMVSAVAVHSGAVDGWSLAGIDTENATGVRLWDLTLRGNEQSGIRAGNGTIVNRCAADGNGEMGIQVGRGSSVTDCTARENFLGGFSGEGDVLFERCVATGNGGTGIFSGGNGNVRNCTASGNESGIGLGSGSVIGCEANDNTPGSGISVLSTGVVQQCHARDNGEDGILVGSSVRVTECSAAQNGDDGIQVAALSSVTGCAVAGNGQTSADGAGIHNPSGQSRIDSNVVSLNPIGISVGGSGGALIVRNTLLSNTMDFDVSSGHVIGTLIDMNAIDGVFTSDAPWANFVR